MFDINLFPYDHKQEVSLNTGKKFLTFYLNILLLGVA